MNEQRGGRLWRGRTCWRFFGLLALVALFGRTSPLVAAFSFASKPSSHRVFGPLLRRCSTRRNAIVPGSTLELIDGETGCEVVLIGCFHGSMSSADDVTTCMKVDDTTEVVVLELCASRFADLRRDMQRQAEQWQGESSSSPDGNVKRPRPWLFRFTNMVSKTIKKRGLSTGLAAALLGCVTGMQTALSGLEPGLEFRTALYEVQAYDKGPRCEIVLADQNVEETLDKIGKLFVVSKDLWLTFFEKGWEPSFGREARALSNAVTGMPGSGNRLNLWDFCVRSPSSVRDMLRLVVPPMIVVQLFAIVVNEIMERLQAEQGALLDFDPLSLAIDPALSPLGILSVLLANLTILAFGYLTLALPASHIILRERDECLTEGIRAACRLAAENADVTSRGRVVAVLGLLHVNGIAERFESQNP